MKKRVLLLATLMVLAFAFLISAPFSALVKVAAEDGAVQEEEDSTVEKDPFEESFGTRYEAEDADLKAVTLKGAGTEADYGVYSGTGFIGCIDFPDSAMIFNVTVETSGEYELYLRYATAMTGATLKVYNDKGLFANVKCPYVSDWGKFDITPLAVTSVSLNAGENSLKIGKGNGYVELDYIEIGKRIGDYRDSSATDSDIRKPSAGFTRYEAEDAEITDGVKYDSGVFSGSGYAGNLDLSTSKVKFTVTVAADGEYEIGLAYAIEPSFPAATLRIFNDDGYYSAVRCDIKLGWGNFTKDALVIGLVSLRAGENTIEIQRGQNFAQLDFIEIGAKVGDWKQGGEKKGSAPAAEEGYVRYEAEEAIVINAIRKGGGYLNDYGNDYYSSRGFVGSFDNDSCYVDIPVKITEDGTYEIKIRYATQLEGSKITVLAGTYGRNGRLQVYKDYLAEHITDWGVFEEEGTLVTTVGLKVGDFIRIKGSYVEIDYVDFGSKVEEYKDGTNVSVEMGGAFGEEEDGYVKAKETVETKKGCSSSVGSLPIAVIALGFAAICLTKKNK